MRNIILCCLFGLLFSSMQAQNFESYYQLAADRHPQLKAIYNEYYALLQEKEVEKALPPLEFSFGAFILPVETRLGAQRLRTGVVQKFPPLGQIKAKTELGQRLAAAKKQEAEVLRNQLYFKMRATYEQLQRNKALQGVFQKQLKRLDVFEQLALQKIKLGKASNAEIFRLELQKDQIKEQIDLLDNQIPLLQKEFATLINAEDSFELDLEDSLVLRAFDYPQDSLESWIHTQNPNLQLLGLKQLSLEQKRVVKESMNKPSFALGMDYVWVTKRRDMDPDFNGRDILMPKAMIMVPLDKKQKKARLKAVDFELLALEDKKEHLKDQLSLALKNALTEYQEAKLKEKHKKEQQKYAQKTLDALIANYSVDAKSFEEILRMEQLLFQLDRQLIQAKIMQNMAVLKIEKLFAQPL